MFLCNKAELYRVHENACLRLQLKDIVNFFIELTFSPLSSVAL